MCIATKFMIETIAIIKIIVAIKLAKYDIISNKLNYTFGLLVYFRFQFGPLYLKRFNLVSYVSTVCISWSFSLVLLLTLFQLDTCPSVHVSVHMCKTSTTWDKIGEKDQIKT
jgi:hypothetical protein